ncbi:amino acid ABC transporter permease [Kaistia nematophila]|uniref:Amino acid ABC transporter permease n=1 Tax=Kaistia nematophila TaxID=2994654 RepID=A0A9X3IL67_9HYPH|nr:amino acid ABC transporter permease [Kaistia nematophila]MCX5570349.1 amino acid ABC transporter permease [Kaistia nematophila]
MTIAFSGPAPAAPRSSPWRQWRQGLFGSPANILITLGFAAFVALVVLPFLRWAVIDATWTGTAQDCAARTGACWAFIGEKARFILFGLYPNDRDWQAAMAVFLLIGLVVATGIPRLWGRWLALAWPVTLGAAIAILSGALTGIWVATDKWGGFPVTALLSVVGFAAAFPIGIGLALARRSNMRLIQLLAVGFIETMRGVPLIAVLYVSTLLLPLMLPAGFSLDKLLRAQIAIVLFVSAYMAEIVRAGLQAVPSGQYEASRSLGLSWGTTMRRVVLPQALRAVIPAFVSLAIGLFLDTTLVIVIGLFDFLNTARVSATDPNWIGFYNEAYAFAAAIYFALSYAASRYSLWLERHLRAVST